MRADEGLDVTNIAVLRILGARARQKVMSVVNDVGEKEQRKQKCRKIILCRSPCPVALVDPSLTFRADVGGTLVNRNPLELIATARTIGLFVAMRQEPTARNSLRIGFIPYGVTKNIFHQFVDLS
jgi:hypothetical protein